MLTSTVGQITEKLYTLAASDLIEIGSIVDGYVSRSFIPPETQAAMDDVRNGRVIRCANTEELYRELGI